LNEIVTALETDKDVKIVVFDSAVEGFFLTHYNFLSKLEDTTSLRPGPTGLSPIPDMLVRLSRAPAVSIASIRGRATGIGSELALASDMRFASRETAILSQWEVGVWAGSRRRSDGPTTTPHGSRTGVGSTSGR
jgi:enoyl-CoA hydratase/carnithine racemase